jgi:transcription initiation factor TFIIB
MIQLYNRKFYALMQPTDPPITCWSCLKDQDVITDIESGEVICGNCGIVITDRAQDTSSPEWRAFTVEEKYSKTRTGAPISLAVHDMGLSTVIGRTNRDASGQILDAAMLSTIKRLRTWDTRIQVHNSEDRNFRQAFQQLDVLKDKLGLSDAIVEKTAYIYRKACERQLPRGKTIAGVLTAAMYIACRDMGIPRTLKEISTISNIKRKDITRNYRMLVFELEIVIPIVDPMNCIIRIADRVKLSDKTKRQAVRMMNIIAKEEIILPAGKNPMGFAASVLYLANIITKEDDSITQIELAEAAGVTEVTIRNICRSLRGYTDLTN